MSPAGGHRSGKRLAHFDSSGKVTGTSEWRRLTTTATDCQPAQADLDLIARREMIRVTAP